MGGLKPIIGEFQWTPPVWLQRIGLRRFLLACLTVVALAVLAVAGLRYYNSLPKPPGVVATAIAPGVTPIVDGKLQPLPLTVDFSVVADPRMPVRTVDSVARLDQVDKTLDSGLTMRPEMPGEWRWQSEKQLIFQPAGDWPAGQDYTVRFDESIFAPGLRLSDKTVEFATAELGVRIDELTYYQNPADRSERKLVATLSFTHPVDAEGLADELTLTMRESGESVVQTPRRRRETHGSGRRRLATAGCRKDAPGGGLYTPDPGTTHAEVFEFWPTDITRLFRQAGVAVRRPPSWADGCSLDDLAATGVAPVISSLSETLSYQVRAERMDRERIPLAATADADARWLYWFIDDRFIGRSVSDEPLLWTPTIGSHDVLAVDDLGRSDAVTLSVGMVQ